MPLGLEPISPLCRHLCPLNSPNHGPLQKPPNKATCPPPPPVSRMTKFELQWPSLPLIVLLLLAGPSDGSEGGCSIWAAHGRRHRPVAALTVLETLLKLARGGGGWRNTSAAALDTEDFREPRVAGTFHGTNDRSKWPRALLLGAGGAVKHPKRLPQLRTTPSRPSDVRAEQLPNASASCRSSCRSWQVQISGCSAQVYTVERQT